MESIGTVKRKPSEMFTLTCVCGQRIEGERTATFRDVACPRCRRAAYVFPTSPFVGAFGPKSEILHAVTSAPRRSRFVIVGSLLALVAAVIVVVVLMKFPTKPESDTGQPAASAKEAHAAVLLGDHRKAAELFSSAAAAVEDANEKRRLEQWHRQTALIADLSAIGLPEMLRRVPGTSEDVWQSTFRQRYAGTAMLFDANIYRDATGEYSLDYALFADDKEIRIAWEELNLLRGLSLDESTRMILGARVADAERTPAGWVVHLRADSGVLITDEEVFHGTSLPPMDDQMRKVLGRQARWVGLSNGSSLDQE